MKDSSTSWISWKTILPPIQLYFISRFLKKQNFKVTYFKYITSIAKMAWKLKTSQIRVMYNGKSYNFLPLPKIFRLEHLPLSPQYFPMHPIDYNIYNIIIIIIPLRLRRNRGPCRSTAWPHPSSRSAGKHVAVAATIYAVPRIPCIPPPTAPLFDGSRGVNRHCLALAVRVVGAFRRRKRGYDDDPGGRPARWVVVRSERRRRRCPQRLVTKRITMADTCSFPFARPFFRVSVFSSSSQYLRITAAVRLVFRLIDSTRRARARIPGARL